MVQDLTDKDFEKYLQENLEKVFGKKKSKQIIYDIKIFKKKHPNQAHSFIFDENGGFKAIKK